MSTKRKPTRLNPIEELDILSGTLTYKNCERLFNSISRKPENGKALRPKTLRLLKADNGNFEIHFKPRLSYPSSPAITITPDDHYIVSMNLWWGRWNVHQAALRWLPEVVGARYWHAAGLRPDSGKPPRSKRPKNVPAPFWVPADHGRRERYEELVAKWGGSLEAWHQARHDDELVAEAHRRKMTAWVGSKAVELWPGAVVDKHGVITQESWDAHEEDLRQEAIREAERQRLAEVYANNLRQHLATFQERWDALDLSVFEGVDVRTVEWMRSRHILPNADGTVSLIKAVNPDFKSRYGVLYEVGTVVEDAAWDGGVPYTCGGGLHFSPTFGEAACFVEDRRRAKSLVCNVDLKTLTCITHDKVKAKSCLVVCEGDEKMLLGDLPKVESAAQKIAAKMAAASRKAAEGDSDA